jgi:hypothetical protein
MTKPSPATTSPALLQHGCALPRRRKLVAENHRHQGRPNSSDVGIRQRLLLRFTVETTPFDNGEQQGRAVVTQQAVKGLERKGMSSQGAAAVVDRLSQGVPWAQIVQQDGQTLDLAGAGIGGIGGSVSTGRHAFDALTPGDAKAIVTIGKIVGGIGTTAEVAVAVNDYFNGAPAGQTIGKAAGGVSGSWLGASNGGALAGTLIGA